MKQILRKLNLDSILERKSIFLFGPRQTGKTSLLRQRYPNAPLYNLLLSDVFLRLSRHPESLREELIAGGLCQAGPVIIDEIQKLPSLLDEVQNLIEAHGCRFVMTGSSARKLKRSGANLLGGRARLCRLHPFVYSELQDFDLLRALNHGTLPPIWTSPDPRRDLVDYCGQYLQEEIQAEAAVRRIEAFSRFLQAAASMNGELVNFENIARECAVPARTVREYFSVLEDTLIGQTLEPYRKAVKRKPVSASKFYFFDIGVGNTLAEIGDIRPKTPQFGKAFEHFIHGEIRAYLDYSGDTRPLRFWRDHAGMEVDFILGDSIAIEAKATEHMDGKWLKPMAVLGEELPLKTKWVVTLEPRPRRVGDVDVLPWKVFLDRLWAGEI